ncbi:uncharacterized protein [Argopecten irradians]|uniref:uncharacterized protein n=1 Tax=Argopecten irradians TaxID=31199 RepID=UPI00371E1ADE
MAGQTSGDNPSRGYIGGSTCLLNGAVTGEIWTRLIPKPRQMKPLKQTTRRQDRRYRWRHDKVLRELADILERERIKKRKPAKGCTFINFVRGGERGHTSSTVHQGGIIDGAQNWEMRVDLDRRLLFPDIIQTNLRPDILLWSTQGKKMVMVELTVPWEERCEEAFERKKGKYVELAGDIRALGWSVWVFPVEIRCRGFPAHSTWRMFAALGVKGRDRRPAVDRMSRTAEKSSSWLWWRRQDMSWRLSTDWQ